MDSRFVGYKSLIAYVDGTRKVIFPVLEFVCIIESIHICNVKESNLQLNISLIKDLESQSVEAMQFQQHTVKAREAQNLNYSVTLEKGDYLRGWCDFSASHAHIVFSYRTILNL